MPSGLLQAGVNAVVITLGAQAAWSPRPGTSGELPAPQVRAIDTVGAGDAFNGALAVALAENRSLEDAAAWATAAAALGRHSPGGQSALPFAKRSTTGGAGGKLVGRSFALATCVRQQSIKHQ